jgi:beta-lactamase regulating signal transducer with metallopeptidase domain
MNFPYILHSVAPIAAERLLFSIGIGTLLAMVVWLLLQLLPKQDSKTSFVVWFSTLAVTAVLPFLYSGHGATAATPTHAVVTVSSWWAAGIFFVWASVAVAGLVRVALALLQIRRLRSKSSALDEQRLSPELAALIGEFRRSRPVQLFISKQLEVPTAIGFFKPAIVLPAWLLEGTPVEELKFILLHELAHLRRRDDWTNLAQQIVKAFLFFLPSIWWIERKLSLDREMACDDAVLAHSGTPRAYAECLAHVAERSFLRRQLALAQAAVARLRQLTMRVTKILDPSRPRPSQLWKPAVPAVVVIAGLCVFSASQAPVLIGFADGAPAAAVAVHSMSNRQAMQIDVAAKSTAPNQRTAQVVVAAKSTLPSAIAKPKMVAAKFSDSAAASEPEVRAWDAALMSSEVQHRAALKKHAAQGQIKEVKQPKSGEGNRVQATLLAETLLPKASPVQTAPAPEYVTVREEFFLVVKQGTPSSTPASWQVHIVEISVVQAQPQQKQVPRKI